MNRLVLGAGTAAASSGTSAIAPLRHSSIVDVRTEPPIVVRHAAGRVLLGASAAGPLGGDDIEIDVAVEPGVAADVGSVGATMVLPGPTGAPSHTRTRIDVGDDAHLAWWPEPMISVAGSRHTAVFEVRLGRGATCCVVDELALGRSCERSGRLTSTLRIERGGRPLAHHSETFGDDQPGAGSVAAGPAAGHVITSVVVGPAAPPGPAAIVGADHWAARLPVGVDAEVVMIVAADRPAALDLHAELTTGLAIDRRRVR
ncbi:MAG: urease accessory protein UreD [Actinomycetota bacterium]